MQQRAAKAREPMTATSDDSAPSQSGAIAHAMEQDVRQPPRPEYDAFCRTQAAWLDDFALYMALKDEHGGVSWLDWGDGLRLRRARALAAARVRLQAQIDEQCFLQFLFDRQWHALKSYA